MVETEILSSWGLVQRLGWLATIAAFG